MLKERAQTKGLTNWKGPKIRKTDITVAKNYLNYDELKQLNLLVEQYLSFAESQALQRKTMYMKDWIRKLHDILTINDRDILLDTGRISHELAEEIANKEYVKFRLKQIREEDAKALEELQNEVKKLKPGNS